MCIDLRENLTITQHASCDSQAFHSAYRLKMHCQHTNTITVTPSMVSLSAGDASKINDVHSINLMDQMSESLWMWMCKASPTSEWIWFTSWTVCLRAQRGDSGWGLSLLKRPVSRAELGQQRLLVGELERCCSLTHTGKKRREKSSRRKSLPFDWGIIRDCLTYLSP